MSVFLQQLKWQFILLQRNYLITISMLLTVVYALIFYIIKDMGNMEKLLTLLIYNDPAIIGLFFIGLSIIIDKNQQVLSALFVTPVNLHTFLLARMVALSLIGGLCGLAMALLALGTNFHMFHFFIGVFCNCLIFTLMGIFLVSYTTEFLLFLLRSIPLLLFMSLPLINYYELADIKLFYLLPVQGCLTLIANSYKETIDLSEMLLGYLSVFIWIPVLYVFVFRIFKSKMVNV